MRAWQCESCGARMEEKSNSCPVCGRSHITEIELPEKEDDEKGNKTYQKVMETLEKYTEGTPPPEEWQKYYWD